MKILTTSDLSYVNGGNAMDSTTGSFNGSYYNVSSGTSSNAGCSSWATRQEYQVAAVVWGAATAAVPSLLGIAATGYAAYCGID